MISKTIYLWILPKAPSPPQMEKLKHPKHSQILWPRYNKSYIPIHNIWSFEGERNRSRVRKAESVHDQRGYAEHKESPAWRRACTQERSLANYRYPCSSSRIKEGITRCRNQQTCSCTILHWFLWKLLKSWRSLSQTWERALRSEIELS